ncbi:MAG: NAD(P)/FAD-dependent oxidoreductase [Deltaproteobacteria bacterium]|nr:NAD(P)/FAD-dependent oxidoreductase [Deltaproteobacteria bacterium]
MNPKITETDVLVVGAGPAGCSAARAAVREGARVLVVERRSKVGLPVRCAELIPAPLLKEVDVGRDYVVQRVRGLRTVLQNGEETETRAPGFTIRRDVFDQALARAAAGAGAEFMLATSAVSRKNAEVLLKNNGRLFEVRAKVIVGADGPHSRVARWIGSENRHRIPAVQITAPLVSPLEFGEVYFHSEIRGGYGWLFPKGSEANVGLGMIPGGDGRPSLRVVLEGFLGRLIKAKKIQEKVLGGTAGWVPAEPIRAITRDNVLLAGDAAGQTHPITGAGVFQAVTCGSMAGVHAARAAEAGDLTLLSRYEQEWLSLFGHSHQRAVERRRRLENEWFRLDEIIKHCWIAFREYYSEVNGES